MYKVSFSKKAGNLAYRDFKGTLYFTFDLDSSRKPPVVIFDKVPLAAGFKMIDLSNVSQGERARMSLACERVRQFLISCGYGVEYLPEINNSDDSY